jgi:hypothetical protein
MIPNKFGGGFFEERFSVADASTDDCSFVWSHAAWQVCKRNSELIRPGLYFFSFSGCAFLMRLKIILWI